MVNNFNLIAPYYDRLAQLIFGRTILNAQLTHLSAIQKEDQVLVLGGGTGKILEYIPDCLRVDFLEKSVRMIDKAKGRSHHNSIDFIEADFLVYDVEKTYDVIVCPFFLDCFNEENLKLAIDKTEMLLKKNGYLLVIDFQKTESNQILLYAMHGFFRFVTKLESKYIKDINGNILNAEFERIKIKLFCRNQIFSRLYRSR